MDKPPYRVPSMTEVAVIPWNGYTVASTFSGCGGSSLGYRMAGYRVGWASEFVAAARDVYKLNAAPGTVLDGRDIRNVTPADVLTGLGLGVGELDVLDGSPPCASFSTAGKRHAGWGQSHDYSDTAQRTDDLFFEFTRILDGVQPRVFVAENVSGLVKGSAKGYFKEILRTMKSCGYRVSARLCDAQWLGVPQARQRLIFIGVRNDLGLDPVHPDPLPYRYTVRDALPWVDQLIHDTSGNSGNWSGGDVTERPSPAITVGSANGGGNSSHYQVLGVGTHHGTQSLDEPAPTILTHGNPHTFSEVSLIESTADRAPDPDGPATDPETGARIGLAGYALARDWDYLTSGRPLAGRRYQSSVLAVPGRASPTVTAEGGSSPGTAAVMHPTERRKFTLGELRRICGFPDDYALSGTYGQRWERLGRAVPPVMMSHIAATIRDRILDKIPDGDRRP